MALSTKHDIYDAMLRLLETEPLSELTISSIVDACEIHRNTFYYHFHDKNDLVSQMIRDALDKELSTITADHTLNDLVLRTLSIFQSHETACKNLFRDENILLLDSCFREPFQSYMLQYFTAVAETNPAYSGDACITLAKAMTDFVEGTLFHALSSNNSSIQESVARLTKFADLLQPSLDTLLLKESASKN